jgi:hypothetical protein
MQGSTLREVAIKVAQYFQDFLESDFKRQQAPRRKIHLQSDTGFRCGMRLRPYPTLDDALWKLLSRPSGEALTLKLLPREHKRPLSATLSRVIQEQIQAIPESALVIVRGEVLGEIDKTWAKAVQDPEAWVEGVRGTLAQGLSQHVVRPLIAHLDGPLRSQAYSVIDSLYAAEGDIVAAVGCDVDALLPDVLAKHLAHESARQQGVVKGALEGFLTLPLAQTALQAFFASFVTADAYLEFRDIETYATINEGLQLYLYMGALQHRGNQYPLFFAPVQVDKLADGSGFQLTVVNQLFANRSAIDFVLQEIAAQRQREWVSPITERINYLTPEQSLYEVTRGLFALVANAVDLAGQVQFSSRSADASTADVKLSAQLHLCAFDRGEEALVNDYEQLIREARQGGSAIVDLFESMVGRMLTDNPQSIAAAVETQWDGLPLVDRLVFDSPIPLNEEQRRVLMALSKPEGKIIVVEGPPGTGKSHTITAIAADCAFNQRSCLVLSDKPEALEVVQGKLSEAMSRVRHDKDFPNPLLRLGRQDANFKRLVGNQTLSQVSAYVRASRANETALKEEREDTRRSMREAIDKTVRTLGSVPLAKVQALLECEAKLRGLDEELVKALQEHADMGLAKEFEALPEDLQPMQDYLERVFAEGDQTPVTLGDRVRCDECVQEFAYGEADGVLQAFGLFEELDGAGLKTVQNTLLAYRQLRMPVFGYLFRGARVQALEQELNRLSTRKPLLLKSTAGQLDTLVTAAGNLRSRLDRAGVANHFPQAFRSLSRRELPGDGVKAVKLALKALRPIPEVLPAMLRHPKDDARVWPLVLSYLRLWLPVREVFVEAPAFDYVGNKTKLERLNTLVMNNHVDGRLVQFMENHRTDAKTLAQLLASRQKFPEEKFEAVRTSFPVIIASIREFGEYMPLVPELFDVVVIDEASQVSVAQALPAVLRAKKLVVLGDSKQFSNVKSSNASNATNEKYRAALVQFFQRNVRDDAESLQRLAMFDVKRSILEFCSMAASFTIMLRKHFRSYQELISYSSSHFYAGQLQAIKVRGVPLAEVIRFEQVDPAGKKATRATNQAEGDFIAAELVALLDEPEEDGELPTVGVITPFREQHTLLTKLLHQHERAQEFERRLRLKVMTFDSCQGEERQIIYYSMVATPGQDALNYVFPVMLENATEAVEEKLKVQRLNVGFSRAQETVVIVHSMPIEQFRGSIGQALNHYRSKLKQRDVRAEQTDQSSPMEARLLQWLQATAFVQNHDDVEIQPQFPIGDYLRQLDPTYQHPSWRVDFLLSCQSAKGPLYIVIEYDGFEYHFDGGRKVHVGNHERYLRESDVERQLTLESYGYRFLRINRFNLGKDPVATLDERLGQLYEVATGETRAASVDRLREQASALLSKDAKACTRCETIRPLQDFYDQTLSGGSGGYGRVCAPCKRTSGVKRRGRFVRY